MFVWLSIASQSSRTFALFFSGQCSSTGMTTPLGRVEGTAFGRTNFAVPFSFAAGLTLRTSLAFPFIFSLGFDFFVLSVGMDRTSQVNLVVHGRITKNPSKFRGGL